MNTFEKTIIGVNIILICIIIAFSIYFYVHSQKENYIWNMPNSSGTGSVDIQDGERTVLSNHPTDRALYVTKATGPGKPGIVEFRHSNGTQGIGFGYNTIYTTGTYKQDLNIEADNDINISPTKNLNIKSSLVNIKGRINFDDPIISYKGVTEGFTTRWLRIFKSTPTNSPQSVYFINFKKNAGANGAISFIIKTTGTSPGYWGMGALEYVTYMSNGQPGGSSFQCGGKVNAGVANWANSIVNVDNRKILRDSNGTSINWSSLDSSTTYNSGVLYIKNSDINGNSAIILDIQVLVGGMDGQSWDIDIRTDSVVNIPPEQNFTISSDGKTATKI